MAELLDHDLGQAACFNWKKRYERITPPEMRRLSDPRRMGT